MAKMKTKLSICKTYSSRTAARKASAAASISAATTSSRRRRRAQAPTASAYVTRRGPSRPPPRERRRWALIIALGPFPEEPLRPGHEHEDQENEGGRIAPGAAQEEGGGALDDAVEEPADDRAAHAAQPAEDDDREGLDGRQRARVGAEGIDDAVERAGERGERGPDPEGQHVHALGADAHQHRADAVLARRADVPPEARSMEHHRESGDDRPGQHEQDDEVVAQLDEAEVHDIGRVRRSDLDVLAKARHEHPRERVLEDQDEGDREEDLVDLLPAPEQAEAEALDDHA